jgi:two-component system phosphate regulon sensor histidine kinase PhoR
VVLTPGTSFWAIVLHLILVTLASFVISLLATVFFARFVTGPLHVIGDFLQGLRPGVRYKKLENSRNDEIGELAHVANKLAERINEDFHQLSIEKDSLDLVLSRIGDGIFVLDGEGVIRSINPSAENIFGLSAKTGQD